MPNSKSAIKNHRKSTARALRNRSRKSRLKTLAKKTRRLAAEGGDREALQAAAREYVSAMDRAAKTNLVHPNKASRAKAQVSRLLSS